MSPIKRRVKHKTKQPLMAQIHKILAYMNIDDLPVFAGFSCLRLYFSHPTHYNESFLDFIGL